MSIIGATLSFILKRTWHRRALLLPTALGLLGVVTVLAGISLFTNAASYVGLQSALHAPGPALSYNLEVRVDGKAADAEDYQGLSTIIKEQIAANLNTSLFNTPPLRTGFTRPLNRFPVGSDHVSTQPLGTVDLWFSSSMNATHLQLLQGSFPSPHLFIVQQTNQGPAYEAEAMISPEWAAQLHLTLNDVLEVVSPCSHPAQECRTVYLPFFRLRIVGFFEPKSLQDPAWFGDLSPFDTEADSVPLWVNENVFVSTPLSEITGATYLWFYYLNLPSITPATAPAISNGLIRLKNTFTLPPQLQVSRTTDVLSGLDQVLQAALLRLFYTNVGALVVLVPGVALLLLYLGLAAFALAEQSREELALMQSRGASRWQLLALQLSETLVLCLLALLVAPFLAGGLALLLVRLSFSGQALRQVDLHLALPTLDTYASAALGAFLCFLVLLLPTLRATQTGLLSIKRHISRPRLLPLSLRLGLGVLLTVLGLYGWLELQQRGAFFLQNLQGTPAVDWAAASAPTLLLVGIAGLSILLLPPALALLDRLAQHLPGIVAGLASRTLARRPGRYGRLVLLLTLTIALGLFAGLSYGTLNGNLDDRAAFLAGADLRLVEGASNIPDLARQAAPLADHLRLLPGVTDGMNALRDSAAQFALPVGSLDVFEAPLLAVDSVHFARIAYWRSDFADTSLDMLMHLIQHAPLQDDALPALVSDQLLSQTTFHVGDNFSVTLDPTSSTGTPVLFRIVGTFHYFPTQPAIVCDLAGLLRLLNQGSTLSVTPNEVWLKLAPNAPDYSATQVEQTLLRHQGQQPVQVIVQQAFDRAAIAESLHADPLQSMIFGTLTLDIIIAGLLSVAGLGILLYLIAHQRLFELSLLRVLGLSRRQLAGTLGWEEVTLLGLSLLLGVPLGVGIATLTLPALAFNELGQPLFLPLVFRLSVEQTVRDAAPLLICLLLALLVTALMFRRLRAQEVLRLGEE